MQDYFLNEGNSTRVGTVLGVASRMLLNRKALMYQSLELSQSTICCSMEGTSQGHIASDGQSQSSWFPDLAHPFLPQGTQPGIWKNPRLFLCHGLPSLCTQLCKLLKRVFGKQSLFECCHGGLGRLLGRIIMELQW